MTTPVDVSTLGTLTTKASSQTLITAAAPSSGSHGILDIKAYDSTGANWTNVRTTASGTASTVALTSSFPAGVTLTGLATPSSSSDAATKAYVDSVATGISAKNSVAAYYSGSGATPVTVDAQSFTLSGADTILTYGAGGPTFTYTSPPSTVTVGVIAPTPLNPLDVQPNNRILVNYPSGADRQYNGVYYVSASTGTSVTLTRTSDLNAITGSSSNTEIEVGTYVFSPVPAPAGWIITTVTALGSPIIFSQFNSATTFVGAGVVSVSGGTISLTRDSAGKVLVAQGAGSDSTWGYTLGSTAPTAYGTDVVTIAASSNTTGGAASGGLIVSSGSIWTGAGSALGGIVYYGNPTVNGSMRSAIKDTTTANKPEYHLQIGNGAGTWTDVCYFTPA